MNHDLHMFKIKHWSQHGFPTVRFVTAFRHVRLIGIGADRLKKYEALIVIGVHVSYLI